LLAGTTMPLPTVEPPLINSSNPWATTAEDLQRLFDCEDTGAVTTRTSLLHGFEHDGNIHQYAFFSPQDHTQKSGSADGETPAELSASLNTLGTQLQSAGGAAFRSNDVVARLVSFWLMLC